MCECFKLFSITTELLRRQYKCLNLMCENTRATFLEVSYEKTSQHSKGLHLLLPREIPHTLLTHTPPWLSETDEHGDRRRCRQTKT